MEMGDKPLICSRCFKDEGLRFNAERFDQTLCPAADEAVCTRCGHTGGRKLLRGQADIAAHSFFVWGTLYRFPYGGAPALQMNEGRHPQISGSPNLVADIKMIRDVLGFGVFQYGPRLWMIGEIEPLKELQSVATRLQVFTRILNEYPDRTLAPGRKFYRVRKDAKRPSEAREYDSPPVDACGNGRLDEQGLPVLYASEDLEVCLHECRVAAEDEIHVATLNVVKPLRLLDLTVVLEETNSEFESLDHAVYMLFLAGDHSYKITRALARAIRDAGYDGVRYPSYFSLVRSGSFPFATSLGISIRRLPEMQPYVQNQTVMNLALFGRPVSDGLVSVENINRVVVTSVRYGVTFGPVGYKPEDAQESISLTR